MVRSVFEHGKFADCHGELEGQILTWPAHGQHIFPGSRQASLGSFLSTAFPAAPPWGTQKKKVVVRDVDLGLTDMERRDNADITPAWRKQWRESTVVTEKKHSGDPDLKDVAFGEAAPLKAGDEFTVKADFLSKDDSTSQLKSGQRGTVKEIDADGNALVDVEGIILKDGKVLLVQTSDLVHLKSDVAGSYCCKPVAVSLSGGKLPCAGYGVSPQCIAGQLDNAMFAQETRTVGKQFANANADFFCCKIEPCRGTKPDEHSDEPTNIKVRYAVMQDPSALKDLDGPPVSTHDIIENGRSCSFTRYPDLHGCRPRPQDPPAVPMSPAGSNFKKCLPYADSEKKSELDEYYSG